MWRFKDSVQGAGISKTVIPDIVIPAVLKPVDSTRTTDCGNDVAVDFYYAALTNNG
jgi:hypothetical protein